MAELYINRELSWLKFNERVLEEACGSETPLYERLKFVSIFASNLDEFYMVRIGSLFDQSLVDGKSIDNKTNMRPEDQIKAVNEATKELYPYRDNAYFDVMKSMSAVTCYHTGFKALDGGEKRIVKAYFESQVLPLLSPQIIDVRHPFPHLENKFVYIGVRLKSKGLPTKSKNAHMKPKDTKLFGVLPLPRDLERIYMVPGSKGYLLAEDIVLRYADIVFDVYNVEAKAVFRVTRNADIDINEGLFDEDTDYRNFMQDLIKKRGKLSPVRLETSSTGDSELCNFFLSKLNLTKSQCFSCESPLDLSFVFKLEERFDSAVKEKLIYAPLRPQWPAALERGNITAQVRKNDILLSYPYESMKPLIELLREASEDNEVSAIKITLYRIGSQSQIVQHLCTAAENGKDVTVIVELRARFDEQSNINWSNVMEEAGCKVIYGIDEYKVHSKILLITRHTKSGTEYITNIATGNYNENTARQYADIAFITADKEIGEDAAQFFHNLNIGNIDGSYRKLLVSPSGLKSGILALIDGEKNKAAQGKPARIIAKMNSLTDKEVIDKLIEASQAGVKISLIIRGICCLRPGVENYTDHIEVISIVGRFLEHSRVYSFGVGSEAKIYIGSADMMTRNTERRIEIVVGLRDPNIILRLSNMLDIQLRDNVKARLLHADGSYTPVVSDGEQVDSQGSFYQQAYRRLEVKAAEAKSTDKHRFVFRSLFKKRD
jgi:polyphosphate kinase